MPGAGSRSTIGTMTAFLPTRRATRWGVAFPLVVLLAFGIPGCSGDDDPSASEASEEEQEQVCADWAELQASVTALGEIEIMADGTDALRGAVDGVEEALRQFGGTAGDQVDEELDALEAAVGDLADELRGALDEPAGDGAGSGLVAVGEAVQQVTDAADGLGAELQPGCET
jgi:hypothetical protein